MRESVECMVRWCDELGRYVMAELRLEEGVLWFDKVCDKIITPPIVYHGLAM